MTRPTNFLEEVPPWLAFPTMQPQQLGGTQGAEETWFSTIWHPFWVQLTQEQKKQYHAHWHTSKEWQEWIDFYGVNRVAGEQEADAAESEIYLRERAAMLRSSEAPTLGQRLKRLIRRL